jgi:hypothetical protein
LKVAFLLTAVVVIVVMIMCQIAEQRIMGLLFVIRMLVTVTVVVSG